MGGTRSVASATVATEVDPLVRINVLPRRSNIHGDEDAAETKSERSPMVNPTFHVRSETRETSLAFVSNGEKSWPGLHCTPCFSISVTLDVIFGGCMPRQDEVESVQQNGNIILRFDVARQHDDAIVRRQHDNVDLLDRLELLDDLPWREAGPAHGAKVSGVQI